MAERQDAPHARAVAQAAATAPEVSLCLLAGGEGRRMGGLDKGLVNWAGRPLALAVLQRLAPQAGSVVISANRHAEDYAGLLQQVGAQGAPSATQVWPDDPDLPPRSGPLAGILTALRRTHSDWLQVVPCDTPALPPDLVSRLMAAAHRAGADIAVPQTLDGPDVPRPHWVCALVHRRTLPTLEAQFAAGERKVSSWVRAQAWTSVFFDAPADFTNINTLETPHAWG